MLLSQFHIACSKRRLVSSLNYRRARNTRKRRQVGRTVPVPSHDMQSQRAEGPTTHGMCLLVSPLSLRWALAKLASVPLACLPAFPAVLRPALPLAECDD